MILRLAAKQDCSALCKVSRTMPPFLVGHAGPLQASVIGPTWGDAKVLTFKCFCVFNSSNLSMQQGSTSQQRPRKVVGAHQVGENGADFFWGVGGEAHRFSWAAINYDCVKPPILAAEFVTLMSTFAKWGVGEASKARRPQVTENITTTNVLVLHRISGDMEALSLTFLFCVCLYQQRQSPFLLSQVCKMSN